MTGVEVLNVIPEQTHGSWLLFSVLIILGIISLSSLVLIIYSNIRDKIFNGREIFVYTTVLILSTLFLFIEANYVKNLTAPKRYQVTIDDSVSYNDFTEKYEVIKVEGKIYTIQEVTE